MSVALLTKPELNILNKRTLKYNLAEAEKDYLLTLVAKIIYESPLGRKLVFKGGTAIHHCYLPQSRFSEDLDFTSLDRLITLDEVKSVLEAEDFPEVKKDYVSESTIKIERLQYSGPLALPNSLKVEIDYLQNVVLPAKEVSYENAWNVPAKVKVMDVREMYAEKIRAASDRARYRDFYDLYLLSKKIRFDMKEIKNLIHQKEMRNPITHASILKNWEMAKREKSKELERIYYAVDIADHDMEQMIGLFVII